MTATRAKGKRVLSPSHQGISLYFHSLDVFQLRLETVTITLTPGTDNKAQHAKLDLAKAASSALIP
ncbi:hypothetical protein [Sinorhizobium sp. BJ1]|uniref:hypothetical protein n=1 Tax=Sinorhizobium sp. BJ1 TaxID=2035455 RepID=UPI000BEA58E1|nr:hypothetical protein [Sinorhizobium sp. BJ1]PDT80425.1 hypothetical protein CO676_28055 [Sinorhizobium sp. BJ1]